MRYSACGRIDSSYAMTVLGAKCAFAYAAAAAGGDGTTRRVPTIGQAYASDAVARTNTAIHGAARSCVLLRITSSPAATSSEIAIMCGKLYRAPSAGSMT